MRGIEFFRPYNIYNPKIRLGPEEDGGYVTSSVCLHESSALFTYGVGNDIRYEIAYYNKERKPVYLFDHTNGWETECKLSDGLHFFSEGLGFGEGCEDFIAHYEERELNGPVLLKIDIEGGEYDYFSKANIQKLANLTTGILVEIHWLSLEERREKVIEILSELYQYFTLTHIHGNSWAVTFDWEGHRFPDVLELSMVNNDLFVEKEPDRAVYPIVGLDYSNCSRVKDIDLSFLNNYERSNNNLNNITGEITQY